jgi:hypothetical protein
MIVRCGRQHVHERIITAPEVACSFNTKFMVKTVAAKGTVPENRNSSAHHKLLIVLCAATDHCAARRDTWPKQLHEDGNSQNISFCSLA